MAVASLRLKRLSAWPWTSSVGALTPDRYETGETLRAYVSIASVASAG